MGKVFSWSEICYGQVPHPGSFPKVISMVRDELKSSPAVVGGLLLGSTLRGDFNLRSDVDCLVIYEPQDRYRVATLTQKLTSRAKALSVPLSFDHMDTKLAAGPFHHLSLIFSKHLVWAAKNGGVIKKNPMELVNVGHLTPDEDMTNSLRGKIRYCQNAVTELPATSDDNPTFYRFLGVLLTIPTNIARNMLAWTDYDLGAWPRAETARLYAKEFGDRAGEALAALHEVDQEYSRELVSQVGGFHEGRVSGQSAKRYARALGHLRRAVPNILDFARLNADLVSSGR